jgi:hypothetical protein
LFLLYPEYLLLSSHSFPVIQHKWLQVCICRVCRRTQLCQDTYPPTMAMMRLIATLEQSPRSHVLSLKLKIEGVGVLLDVSQHLDGVYEVRLVAVCRKSSSQTVNTFLASCLPIRTERCETCLVVCMCHPELHVPHSQPLIIEDAGQLHMADHGRSLSALTRSPPTRLADHLK